MKKILLFTLLAVVSLFAQVEFVSSDLPIVIIDTKGAEIPDDPKIQARMGIIYNGPGLRNNVTDPWNNYDGYIGIEIRGSSSQMFPKKQYGIETTDSLGEDLEVSLLGLPKEEDWILFAPYNDKTLMRDALAYHLARLTNRYAVRSKYVEVVINGDYKGVYVLFEKIKRDKNRVGISKNDPENVSGDAVTGGYIIKIDKMTDQAPGSWWQSPYISDGFKPVYYLYEFPKPEDINEYQENYIQNYFQSFETTLAGSEYSDPFTGYPELLDVEAFIDYVLINELAKNIDAYRLSTFLHKDVDSKSKKLVTGPQWDHNLSFGNADYYEGYNPQGWMINTIFPDWESFEPPFWWKKLFNDEMMFNKFSKRWHELRLGVLSNENIISIIDSISVMLSEAKERNFERWPVLDTYVWPNYYWDSDGTYEWEIGILKSWISERLNWIDDNVYSQPSSVNWISNPDGFANYSGTLSLKIPLAQIYGEVSNIDSVGFISENDQLEFTITNDTLIVKAYSNGDYRFKGLAYLGGNVQDMSVPISVSFSDVSASDDKLPAEFSLKQNYPNPFNPATTIEYSIPVTLSPVTVSLVVYNILGQEVATLVNAQQPAGRYEVKFDAGSASGGLSSGMYIYRIKSGSFSDSKRMMLVK